MTFKDRKLNSMTFQALKLKLLNSMTFQVFHDLYEPCYNPANGLTFTWLTSPYSNSGTVSNRKTVFSICARNIELRFRKGYGHVPRIFHLLREALHWTQVHDWIHETWRLSFYYSKDGYSCHNRNESHIWLYLEKEWKQICCVNYLKNKPTVDLRSRKAEYSDRLDIHFSTACHKQRARVVLQSKSKKYSNEMKSLITSSSFIVS